MSKIEDVPQTQRKVGLARVNIASDSNTEKDGTPRRKLKSGTLEPIMEKSASVPSPRISKLRKMLQRRMFLRRKIIEFSSIGWSNGSRMLSTESNEQKHVEIEQQTRQNC